jgi:Mn-containing catalase
MEKIFNGTAPANDGTELRTMAEPKESYEIPSAPERPEEFAPGLDPELQELADALTVAKEKVKRGMKLSGGSPKKAAAKK